MTDPPPSTPEAMTAPPAEPRDRSKVIGDGISWAARWCARALIIALALVVLGLLVGKLWSIVLPVLLALLIASVLGQPAGFLENRLHFPAGLAAGVTVLGSVLLLIGVIAGISPAVVGQSGEIVDSAADGLQDVQDWVQTKDFISQDQIDAGLQALQDRLGENGSAIASGVLTGLGAATSAVVTLVITLILTFLFLKDGRRFPPLVARLAGDRAGPHLVAVMARSWLVLGGYIRTQALVSLIDAVLIGFGLVLVGVPLAIPLAIITFIGGFIPIIGAFVAGILAVLVALVSVGPTGALIVLLVVVAVQQLEGNVLSPWLQSKSMQLHAGVVLLSVALASTLFGIVGAFLAVPVVAVGAVVIRYLDEQVAITSGEPPPEPPPEAVADPDPEEVQAMTRTEPSADQETEESDEESDDESDDAPEESSSR